MGEHAVYYSRELCRELEKKRARAPDSRIQAPSCRTDQGGLALHQVVERTTKMSDANFKSYLNYKDSYS